MRQLDLTPAAKAFELFPNVVAAWVFGSAKVGAAREGSDLDIGVLFAKRPGLDELATLRADLQAALDFEEIDLSILNDASPVLRFEAVSGRGLFCRDVAERARFASLAAREYEHAMTMLRRHSTPKA